MKPRVRNIPAALPARLDRSAVKALCDGGLLAARPGRLDGSGVTQADDAGQALLLLLERRGWTVRGVPPGLLRSLPGDSAEQGTPPAVAKENPLTALGRWTCEAASRPVAVCAYLGEMLCSAFQRECGRFRWGDFRQAFCRCGVEAVPVMGLVGFLLGLILAFQSAIPLKMFGGEGFVGGLVGIALVRELGLILAAILMAGRSGSAFAAEIGTMKVNEELDALETMGLRPVRFLVLPRVLAGTLALPLLSLCASAAGLLGGWVVMAVLGFSAHYYVDQLQTFVALGDLTGSFAKAFVFGFSVSAVGCWHGLSAGRDAGAVGVATTAAVVTGIVMLTALEGLFSVVFYVMGW